VKLTWLMSFLVAPILANSVWRVLLVVLLNSCDLNSCDSAAGMAAANGLAVNALVFVLL